jgi:hypothetical protein
MRKVEWHEMARARTLRDQARLRGGLTSFHD